MSELYETTEEGIEVYYTRIHEYLDDFMKDRDIKDMSKESQNKWNAALIYIYNHVFKNNKWLKVGSNTYDIPLKYNNNSNCNAYDINKANQICDIYIMLCYEYDKEISISGFCKLTGISKDCILGWTGREGYAKGLKGRANESSLELYKKLNEEREESLSGLLISGKRPPVAILGALNRWYGWNMSQPQQEQKGLPDQTAADIAARHELGDQGKGMPQLPNDL